MLQQRKSSIIIFTLLLFTVISATQGCSIFHKSSQRKAEKQQHRTEVAAQKEYDKAKKQHFKNQSKDTRKMMAKSRKKAKKLNVGKQRSFFNRGGCR